MLILECRLYVRIVTRTGVTIEGGMDWMIGFIDHLYTVLGTTGNYSAVLDLHPLHRYTHKGFSLH
jgi:hypothetical protein